MEWSESIHEQLLSTYVLCIYTTKFWSKFCFIRANWRKVYNKENKNKRMRILKMLWFNGKIYSWKIYSWVWDATFLIRRVTIRRTFCSPRKSPVDLNLSNLEIVFSSTTSESRIVCFYRYLWERWSSSWCFLKIDLMSCCKWDLSFSPYSMHKMNEIC